MSRLNEEAASPSKTNGMAFEAGAQARLSTGGARSAQQVLITLDACGTQVLDGRACVLSYHVVPAIRYVHMRANGGRAGGLSVPTHSFAKTVSCSLPSYMASWQKCCSTAFEMLQFQCLQPQVHWNPLVNKHEHTLALKKQ